MLTSHQYSNTYGANGLVQVYPQLVVQGQWSVWEAD